MYVAPPPPTCFDVPLLLLLDLHTHPLPLASRVQQQADALVPSSVPSSARGVAAAGHLMVCCWRAHAAWTWGPGR
jgi:hypothetical protein